MDFDQGHYLRISFLTLPRKIARIFGKKEEYLDVTEKILKNSYALCFLVFFQYNGPAILQSMKKGVSSLILSLLSQFVPFIIFAFILYI